MAVSKARLNGALLLLRIAIGAMAMFRGFEVIRHAALPHDLSQMVHLLFGVLEVFFGLFIIIGLLMPWPNIVLTVVIGWPVFEGWMQGAPLLSNLYSLFLLLVTLASALGGAGRWAIGRD